MQPLLQQQIAKLQPQLPQLTPTELELVAQSDFVADCLLRFAESLSQLRAEPPQADEWQHYATWLQQAMQTVQQEDDLMRVLRQFRQQMMLRIAWMQLQSRCATEQTLQQLSTLAEVLIIAARDWLYQACCQEYGTPTNAAGQSQPLLILAMGKLGGGELNFSSDVDLIFAFPESGMTVGGRRQFDNSTFFTRLGQRLIKVLSQPTEDGLVYRVDMRLRPLGDGGPLVISFAALEDYYQEQGRDWERYAMVKARVLGHETDYAEQLQQLLRPFIYRRYIDFSVVQSLRKMKSMIEREVRRRGLVNNIKLGAGGIREVEFIVQVFQLIRGGRELTLQTQSLLQALQAVAQLQLLSAEEANLLRENYLFLRRLENLLQAIDDQQTQTLPEDALNQQRLAVGMRCADWDELYQQLQQRLAQNRQIFATLIGDEPQPEPSNQAEKSYEALWLDDLSLDELQQLLPTHSLQDCQQLALQLQQFRQDLSKRTIGVRGRDILDLLMPRLLAALIHYPHSTDILPRLCKLLCNIVSRTTYLELLLENPTALQQLIKLCAASVMVSDQLAQHPLLLDELIDGQALYYIPAATEYQRELQHYLLRIGPDDEEQQLEALRQFKQMQLLHIAAADIAERLTTMQVSDHLTYLAEAIVAYVVRLAWQQMTARYGQPDYLPPQADPQSALLVIAYGKLGGWELGYGSDLDLVFVHNCPAESVTDGARQISSRQFFLRLVQRIHHLFSVRTCSGILYEVDLRLRPEGDAGLLATTLAAFADYQQHSAWTWEHQALVRARAIYGSAELMDQFGQLRQQILMLPRQSEHLKQQVSQMRQKMRQHLAHHPAERFDLKLDSGGIGDIEFMSQYLVLNFAADYPQLTRWSDNVRILAIAAEQGIISEQQAEQLTQAYLRMRDLIHHLALQKQPALVSADQLQDARQVVQSIWQQLLQ